LPSVVFILISDIRYIWLSNKPNTTAQAEIESISALIKAEEAKDPYTFGHSERVTKIALVIEINNISLDINTAIPCGLIINELLTNSLKHAFPAGEKGEIKIAIHSWNEKTIVTVSVVEKDGAGRDKLARLWN